MPLALTPAARSVLHVLQFRDSLGPMYVAHAHRARAVVVAHELTGLPRLAAVAHTSLQAIWDLDRAGLVQVAGWHEEVPLDYSGRRHGDQRRGCRIELLAAGRATCPTCAGTGSEPCRSPAGRIKHGGHPKRPARPPKVSV